MPKTLKIVLILIGLYAASVALFESMLGYFQPENQATLVVTTYDAADVGADRVLVRIEHEGELFVAVNHWPRQWYGRLLDNDQVRVRFEDVDAGYTASKVPEAEQAALDTARPLGLGFRVLTGFPPRYFVRLTPNA
ncbi:MAG: hypothetical protein HN453_07420 [Gammaproteobacteria bacterium]|jgi:hypothetical protein|nr:hypothetical protein [Gammaproteobacteria bacterium]